MAFLFSPFGRVSLGQFWLYFLLPMFLAQVVAVVIDTSVFKAGLDPETLSPRVGPLSILVGLFYLWPSFAVTIKRYHDHNMTGWWVPGSILLTAVAITSGLFAMGPSLIGMGSGTPLAFLAFVPSALGVLWLFVMLYLWPGQSGGNAHGPNPSGRSAEFDYGFQPEARDQNQVEPDEAGPAPIPAFSANTPRFNLDDPRPKHGPRVSFGHRGG